MYWEESEVGVVRVDVEKMFDVEMKKKNDSYVRVLDKFYKINKISGSKESNSKIGELRVKIIMQDLGPVEIASMNNRENREIEKMMVKE